MTRHTAGPDYDPDRDELLRERKGNPITSEYIEELADEAEGGYDLEEEAGRQGKTVSQLASEALEQYLHAS